jgi:hypothetical protein
MIRHFITLLMILLLAATATFVSQGSPADDQDPPARPAVTESDDTVPVEVRYSAEEKALMAIQEGGRVRVRELARLIAAETDPERRSELSAQAVEVKQQTRLRFLETLADFARQRGDEVVEQQALDQIENIKNPPRVSGTPLRQTADKSEVQRGAK